MVCSSSISSTKSRLRDPALISYRRDVTLVWKTAGQDERLDSDLDTFRRCEALEGGFNLCEFENSLQGWP